CEEFLFQAEEDSVTVDLQNPLYRDGVLSTDQGGILTAPNLRIQAQKLVYTRKLDATPQVFSAVCEGNLLVDYKDRVLVGERFEYDFLTQTGRLFCGRTANPPWFVEGEEILFCSNGELKVINGYITTSETGERDVEIFSPEITLSRDGQLNAKSINFRMKQVPLFWLPKLHIDTKNYGHSPMAIQFGWGGYLGTRLGVRYQFLDFADLKGFGRLDGYLGRGLGGGIDTTYNPKYTPLEWHTRNYYAHDLSISDPQKRNRYRFQGTYYNKIFYESTSADLMYDVVSDGQMAADYQFKDFDLNAAGRTQLELRRQSDSLITNLFARPKVNSCQSVNQELPTFALQWHPIELWGTGVVAENLFKAAYLDYDFSDDIGNATDFHSGRVEIHPKLYRPFHWGPATLTPEAEFIGIAYSNTPGGDSAGQTVGDFGCKAETAISKCYTNYRHVVEPYAHFHYLTNPSVPLDRHLLFTINDGYSHLSLLRLGVRNGLFSRTARPLWFDLWTNAFFDTSPLPQSIPKGYLDIEWQPHPRLLTTINSGWNFAHHQLDFFNSRIDWTLSENFAASVEYRHRGRYDWRKADFYNFILESVRSEPALLASLLSDRRDTFLFHAFYRINPDWTAKFQLREGWARTRKATIPHRPYLEYQVDLSTLLFKQWRLYFTYEKRESDNRYAIALKLNPGPPGRR
nr:hypothetical protein [Chlamydiota bacterium]